MGRGGIIDGLDEMISALKLDTTILPVIVGVCLIVEYYDIPYTWVLDGNLQWISFFAL